MFRGFVDMWQIWFWKKYSDRPLHLFGVAGVFLTLIGSGMLFVLFVLRVAGIISLSTSIWPTISVLLIITGMQLFIFGIMMDLMIRSLYAAGAEKSYIIKEEFEV